MGLQRVTRGFKRFQGVTTGYMGYKALQRVLRG